MSVEQYRNNLNKLKQLYILHKSQVRIETTALDRAKTHLRDCIEAQKILQHVAHTIQQQVHCRIAGVVTKCLQMVFGESYEFDILFNRKRGKAEAELVFKKDGHILDPMESVGGGLVDVAAFALRLACLQLQQPKIRQLLVMDEPFRFVSAKIRERVRDMMELLSKEMDLQIILVTHQEELTAGTIVKLSSKSLHTGLGKKETKP